MRTDNIKLDPIDDTYTHISITDQGMTNTRTERLELFFFVHCFEAFSTSTRTSLTRMRACTMLRFSLSALDLLPEYVGRMSLDISSSTANSWEYLETGVGAEEDEAAANCAA